MLPTFIIPGAAKSGSTSLYHNLCQHPDILMSSNKEPNFFLLHWGKDITFYQQFFSHYSGEKAIGEATVGYMPDTRVPARIYSVLPNVKLIFTLRNPVSRAVSHYVWRVNKGQEHRSFDEVLQCGFSEYPILYSLYYTHISRFLEYFPI